VLSTIFLFDGLGRTPTVVTTRWMATIPRITSSFAISSPGIPSYSDSSRC